MRRPTGALTAAAALFAVLPTLTGTQTGTLTGIDVLRGDQFALLRGKRVALLTNQTGLVRGGTRSIDLLASAAGVRLVALFSPEHGLRGELDDNVPSSR